MFINPLLLELVVELPVSILKEAWPSPSIAAPDTLVIFCEEVTIAQKSFSLANTRSSLRVTV